MIVVVMTAVIVVAMTAVIVVVRRIVETVEAMEDTVLFVVVASLGLCLRLL